MSRLDPIFQRILLPLTKSPSTLTPKITPGEIVKGTVLGQHSPGRVFIRLKGVPVLAQTYNNLEDGMELILKVEEVSSRVVLRILSSGEAILNKALPALRTYLAYRAEFSKLMEPLKDLILRFPQLSHAVLDLTKDISPDYLRWYLHNLGLSFENRLSKVLTDKRKDHAGAILQEDCKGLLSRLTGILQEEQSGVLLKDLRSLLQFIECQQIINTGSIDQENRIFLAFPYFAGEAIRLAEFSISFPKRREGGQSKKDSFRISFLLNMPNLGPIRIDMMVLQKQIWCTFILSEKETSDFIVVMLPDLSKRFEQLGYRPENIGCLVKDDGSLNNNSLFEELLAEDRSTVDFFI